MNRLVLLRGILVPLLLTPTFVSAHEETVIECTGTIKGRGINAPKNIFIPSEEKITQRYLIGRDYIKIPIDGATKDMTLNLCKANTSHYQFAYNCKITNKQQFIIDWLNEKDLDPSSSTFFKKYLDKPNSVLGDRFISLDRINLSINDEDYSVHSRTDAKLINKEIHSNTQTYFIVDEFRGNCKKLQPKL
jgi:hypothetical protein